jgi:hypothetical protein
MHVKVMWKVFSEIELDVMDVKQLATITCYNCQKKGHLARDCPLPRKPGKGKKPVNFKARMFASSTESSDPSGSSESCNSSVSSVQ